MRYIFVGICVISILTACVGELRTVMISNFGLTPAPPGIREYPKYFVGLNASTATLDNALLLQLYSGNFQDLADRRIIDAPFYISGLVSSKIDGVSIDASSFILDNLDGIASLQPDVSFTSKRVSIEVGDKNTRVCSYYENSTLVATPLTGIVSIREYDGSEWPPNDIDGSVLCVLLTFKISVRSVSPIKRYQLHFRYFIRGVPKEATLYFYPIKYRYFQS